MRRSHRFAVSADLAEAAGQADGPAFPGVAVAARRRSSLPYGSPSRRLSCRGWAPAEVWAAFKPNHVGLIDPRTNEIVAEIPVRIHCGPPRSAAPARCGSATSQVGR